MHGSPKSASEKNKTPDYIQFYPDTDRNIAIISLNLSMHIGTYTIESLIHNNSIYRSESRITDENQTTREFLAAHGP